MPVSFDRPVGAPADLAEIEYVAALHQSQPGHLRPEASIKDVDVMRFLKSRYGIEVDLPTIRKSVLTGLGGGFDGGDGERKETGGAAAGDEEDEDADEDEEVIDLAELVSILLIPALLQSARQEAGDDASASPRGLTRKDFDSDAAYVSHRRRRWLERSLQPPRGLVRHVLSMILNDVTGSTSPRRATPSLVREILIAYGEEGLSRDDGLVDEVVAALGGGGGDGNDDDDDDAYLDAGSFSRALTADVRLYDAGNLARETSNFDDVLTATTTERPFDNDGAPASSRRGGVLPQRALPAAEDEGGGALAGVDVPVATDARRVVSVGAIDYIADLYRSKLLVVLLWTAFVLSYVGYYDAIDRAISEARISGEMQWCDNYTPLRAKIQCYEDAYKQRVNAVGLMNDIQCGEERYYACLIVKSILNWLYILGLLMAFGLAFVGLGSIGNNVLARRKWPIILGILSVGCLSYLLFFAVYRTEEEDFELGYGFTVLNETTNEKFWVNITATLTESRSLEYESLVYYLALIFSTFVIVLQCLLLIGPLVKRYVKSGPVASFFTPGSVAAEARLKRAAARKLNGMVKNAREMHGEIDGGGGNASFGRGLINFSLQGEKFETAGGFLWTWKKIFSGDLFEEEGVWISSRIWAGNLAQALISFTVLTFGLVATREVVSAWRKGLAGETNLVMEVLEWFGIRIDSEAVAAAATVHVDAMMNDFVTMSFGEDRNCEDTLSDAIADASRRNSFTNLANLDASQLCVVLEHAADEGLYDVPGLIKNITDSTRTAVKMATDEVSDSLYPQEEMMVKAPLLLATSVAFVTGVVLTLIYIPSVTSTILRFRSGTIPFLHDRKAAFLYRAGMDQVLTVLGSMFWGALYSAMTLGAIFGGILFLFLWQATKNYMAQVLCTLIGLVITTVVRLLLILGLLRATVFSGFYRRKLAQGNIVSLILECANIGYAVGTALARGIKLLLISALYIGRMDTPLLADDVGFGPLRDMYPVVFRKEILAHEAHRHPYLEVLGTMYLMKIRYGDNFGNRAGYSLRLIFAVALMPWIRKYRVMARPNLIEDEGKGRDIDAENFDNNLLLPKSSVLRSSVLATSVVTTGIVEDEPITIGASESEVRKLKDQIEEKDQEIAAQGEEIQRLREMLQNCSSTVASDTSVEVQQMT